MANCPCDTSPYGTACFECGTNSTAVHNIVNPNNDQRECVCQACFNGLFAVKPGNLQRVANPCNCENVSHFEPRWPYTAHGYQAVAAGEEMVPGIGRVCDVCAATHMREFLARNLGN